MDIGVILSQMAMLFAMMLTGYFVWKKEWFDENAYARLSKIVVNIFNPLLAIYGVAGKNAGKDVRLVLQNLGFVLFFYVFLTLAGVLVVLLLRLPQKEKRIYRLMTIFPNVGFMGMPVITSIFGMDSMIYIVFYMLGYNLLLYTYGLSLARKAAVDAGNAPQGKEKGGWKRMVNPGMVSSVVAIAIFLLQLPLPSPVLSLCDYMGNATIPLSMLLIGMSIAKADLKKIFSNKIMYVFAALKMVVIPLSAILLLRPLKADPVVFGVFVLQLSMPVGSILTLIAKENGADEAVCTNGIVLSTLASIATIPLVCMFL